MNEKFYNSSVSALSAAQVAGTEVILQENLLRGAIMFAARTEFAVSITPTATRGARIAGSFRDSLSGDSCPKNALYLVPGSGLIAGDDLMIWER